MKKFLGRSGLKILKILFVSAFSLTLISGAILALIPPRALAQDDNPVPLQWQPQLTIPGSNFQNNASTSVGQYNSDKRTMTSALLGRYIKALYDYGLGIAGILAAIVLMAGGILWLTSAGNESKVGQAKELISGSITGIVILFCSWILLNTISPDLINLKPIVTTNVGEIATVNYCSRENGYIKNVTKDGSDYYSKDGEKIKEAGEACTDNEVCISQYYLTNGQDGSYKCLSTRSLKCCQYARNNTTGITCLDSLADTDCPAEHNGNELFQIYPNINCDYQFNNSGRNPCVKNSKI